MVLRVLLVGVSGEPAHCCVGPRCLKRGDVLVFTGESVARYQYLDLVYGLHGKDAAMERRDRNPLEEGTWTGGWADFFANTSAELAPHERCDCHRGSYETMLENRVYTDRRCNVSVVYIQVRSVRWAATRSTQSLDHLTPLRSRSS